MYTKVLPLLALVGVAHSHMRLEYPPILKGDNNPNTQGEPDPFSHYPYGCCGQEVPGPCRGHIDLLDTDEGKPVVEWAPGQKANFTLNGRPVKAQTSNVEGGNHYGGSCQVGFSVDKGKTFKVATTWQGNCPLRNNGVDPSGQVFDFTVPADIPATERALFAWVWVNREKEFFMTCSSVTIGGGNGNSQTTPQQPQSSQPAEEDPENLEGQNPEGETPKGEKLPTEDPSRTEEEGPKSTEFAPREGSMEYTLEGCTCSCPAETWSKGCECYECRSPATKRHLVERKALEMHKRHLLNAEKLNAPLRRQESMPWDKRPAMLTSIDFAGAKCKSAGNPNELKFPNPGPDVVEGDGEYELKEPTC